MPNLAGYSSSLGTAPLLSLVQSVPLPPRNSLHPRPTVQTKTSPNPQTSERSVQANFYKSHYLSIQETIYTAATACEPMCEFYASLSCVLHEIQVMVFFFLSLLNSTLEPITKPS